MNAESTISYERPDAFEGIARLTKDLKAAAIQLSEREVRFLVDRYYQIQEDRKRQGLQKLTASEAEEPNALVDWLFQNQQRFENDIKRALDAYSASQPLGQWARSIVGIGPVIAAGLMAHIDIKKAPTVGHIWSFAGLVNGQRWEKGTKRPWNADLKVLCWKIGESFVKVKGNRNDVYGKVYQERKDLETQRNEAGEYARQAAEKLERFRIGKDTDAYGHYSSGHLPPAHIHARAKRYAVKLFLAHYHHVAFELAFGGPPPKPYVIAFGEHAHFIAPPNWS